MKTIKILLAAACLGFAGCSNGGFSATPGWWQPAQPGDTAAQFGVLTTYAPPAKADTAADTISPTK